MSVVDAAHQVHEVGRVYVLERRVDDDGDDVDGRCRERDDE